MEARLAARHTPITFFLPIIILFEGFVSIAVEILSIRQLLPVAGGSVVVTSLIIGFFLLFLALGYQQGGRITTNQAQRLQNNFFVASIWLGIGLSYLFIKIFFIAIQKLSGPHVIYPLIAYLLVVTSPLIYILGQTVPISMNLVSQDKPTGMIGGNTLGLSTLGSFLGATVTTLFLMYYFGVARTIFANVVILLTLSLLLSTSILKFIFQLLLGLSVGLLIYLLNVSLEESNFVYTTNYANYQIQDKTINANLKDQEKMLIINDAFSSYTNGLHQGFSYIEAIKKILFQDLAYTNKHILVLGAGGFTISAESTFDNYFTYVDIDAHIKKVVVPKFNDAVNGSLIVDDARHFLLSSNKKFDAIVVDVYTDVKAIPAHLLTKEFMQTVKNHLAQKSVAVFNVIANPNLSDPYSKRIDNTIRSVFSQCMVSPLFYGNRPTNILYVCQQNYHHDNVVYSDNRNNSTTDSFMW